MSTTIAMPIATPLAQAPLGTASVAQKSLLQNFIQGLATAKTETKSVDLLALMRKPSSSPAQPSSLTSSASKTHKLVSSRRHSDEDKYECETNCSSEEETMPSPKKEEPLPMATLKKPKKHFKNKADRERFVRSYQIKYKTEMCKNWELFGSCKFKNNCSFAHGEHEL